MLATELQIVNVLRFNLAFNNFSVISQGSHRNSKIQFHDFSMINNVISMTI